MENLQHNDTNRYNFILFVSGMSVKSAQAIENLKNICDTYLPEQFELQIIDITQNADHAVSHQIIAVPTLIKTSPGVKRTIIGDLSNTEKVIQILDLGK